MRLRREASIGIAAILGLQILLSTLTIALLMRMGPAIDRILEENVSSEAAVEDMLAVMAASDFPSAVPKTFESALDDAKKNVTQEDERELVNQVDQLKYAAFQDTGNARLQLIEKLQLIGEANRQAMHKANGGARALGDAGAWAAAFLGAVALALGIAAYRRLLLRIEHPVDRILSTFVRIRSGNQQARCITGPAPAEITQIGKELNWVVDQWQKALHRRAFAEINADDQGVSRRLLCAVVDQYARPLIIRDAQGNQVAANHLAIGLDTTGWVERPLIKTEYYFFLPPDEVPDDGDFVREC